MLGPYPGPDLWGVALGLEPRALQHARQALYHWAASLALFLCPLTNEVLRSNSHLSSLQPYEGPVPPHAHWRIPGLTDGCPHATACEQVSTGILGTPHARWAFYFWQEFPLLMIVSGSVHWLDFRWTLNICQSHLHQNPRPATPLTDWKYKQTEV